MLVYYLLDGPMRFSDLRRAMPDTSQRMLMLDLRALEKVGLVTRDLPAVPPKVEYSLTAEGRQLKSLVDLMGEVGERLTRYQQKQAT